MLTFSLTLIAAPFIPQILYVTFHRERTSADWNITDFFFSGINWRIQEVMWSVLHKRDITISPLLMFLLFFFFFCWSHEVFTPTAPQSVSPLSMVIQHGMLWSIINTPLINTHTATPASWFISLKREISGWFQSKSLMDLWSCAGKL